MENCADARRRRREVVRSPWFGKYRGIEIGGRQLLLLSPQLYGTELKPNLALFLVPEIPASSNPPPRHRARLFSPLISHNCVHVDCLLLKYARAHTHTYRTNLIANAII